MEKTARLTMRMVSGRLENLHLQMGRFPHVMVLMSRNLGTFEMGEPEVNWSTCGAVDWVRVLEFSFLLRGAAEVANIISVRRNDADLKQQVLRYLADKCYQVELGD